jgi:hypothetical protein
MNNMNDIRNMLCEEIEKLRQKQTTPSNVNAITNATGKILSTIKLELEYAKLLGQKPKNSGFLELVDVEIKTPEPKTE